MLVVARPPQRQKSVVLAAATNIQVNRVLYSAVVPAFGFVLLVLALKKGFNSGKHSQNAYAFIASVSVLSGLVGALGSQAQVETIIQALLSLFLCIPVLHLTSIHNTGAHSPSRCQFIIRTLLKSLLFISLSGATLFTVLKNFLTSKLPAAVHPAFPTTLFLAYTIFALCLLFSLLFPKNFRVNPATLTAIGRKPISIDIHVSTRSAAVPINLARSSCFSAPDLREQYQEPDNFSIDHLKRASVDSGISIISAFKPSSFVGSVQPSCSISRQRTDTVEFRSSPVLRFSTRTRDLLPLLSLLLAQLALCASYACKLASDYKPAPLLEIIQNLLNVVSVMASMKAYILHAYNSHLGSLGLPTRSSNGATPNLLSHAAGQQASPFGPILTPSIPAKSLASPLSSVLGHRLRVSPDPVRNTGFEPNVRAHHRPQSASPGYNRSTLRITDNGDKERNTDNGRLMNSVSVGSLKSAYGTGGSEESDLTRVEGSVESDIEIVETRVGGLKGTLPHVNFCHMEENPGPSTSPPENLMPKRLLGFGWLNGMTNRYRESREGKPFIDMGEQRCSVKSSASGSPTGTHKAGQMHPEREHEPRKLKRSITIASSFTSMTSHTTPSHPPSAFTYKYWDSDSTLCRTSGDLETDMIMGNIPATPGEFLTKKMVEDRNREHVFSKYGMHTSPDKSRCDKNGHSRDGRTSSQGGLRLKRSFRVDDGRTLSPQLTLAAAITGEDSVDGNVNLSSVEAESNSGSCWETEVEVGHELIQNVGSSQVRETTKTESDRKSPETFSLTRINIQDIELQSVSGLVRSQKLAPNSYPGSEQSRKRPQMMNLQDIVAQRPLEVTGFIPTRSESPIGDPIPSITPAAFTYPSTPSETASCSSSTTASPLVPDRTPMIFGHGQRSRETFPLARIPTFPSRTQPVLRRHNAEAPITPTRGQSTFSSSSSSSSLRLSAVTIESVKNAFSGVWSGKRTGRTGPHRSLISSTASESVNRESLQAPTFSGVVILEDGFDGDFMDLRDPFASPRAGKVRRIPSGGCAGMASVDSSEDGHGERCKDVLVTTGSFRRKKNPWGRLPATPTNSPYSIPGKSESYAITRSLTGAESRNQFSRMGDDPLHAQSKELRKERRIRKRKRGPAMPMARLPVLDDMDFDIEEALLTQRLLKRLDDAKHGEVRP